MATLTACICGHNALEHTWTVGVGGKCHAEFCMCDTFVERTQAPTKTLYPHFEELNLPKPVGADVIHQIATEAMNKRAHVLEGFVRAYLESTGLQPQDVVLEETFEQGMSNMMHTFNFRPKEGTPPVDLRPWRKVILELWNNYQFANNTQGYTPPEEQGELKAHILALGGFEEKDLGDKPQWTS